MKKWWLLGILALCWRVAGAQGGDTLPAALYLKVEAMRRLPPDLEKAARVADLSTLVRSDAPQYTTLLDEAARIAAAHGRADLLAILEEARGKSRGQRSGPPLPPPGGGPERAPGHRPPAAEEGWTTPGPEALRAAYAEVVRSATASGDRVLLQATRITYADHMVRWGRAKESVGIYRGLAGGEALSENDRHHILCQLVICLFKLGQRAEANAFYAQLQERARQGLAPGEEEEWWLATALHHEHGGRPLAARAAYTQLAGRGEPLPPASVEAALRLALLYSRGLQRDSADWYFNLVGNRPLPPALQYEQAAAAREHRQRFRQQPAGDGKAVLTAQDSLYHGELVRVTRELRLQNEVLESRRRAERARQQQQISALEGARLQQRFILLVLALCLGTLVAVGVAYTIFLRRRQAALLHHQEVERLQVKHRHEVLQRLSRAQEAERGRIAGQLHDEIGSMLSVARLHLSALAGSPGADADRARLQTADKLLGTIATTVRAMSHQLMPIALKQYGLKQAVRQLVADINAAGPLAVEEVIVGFDEPGRYPEEFATGVYRIVQEGLQNMVRHSGADRALLQLVEHDDGVSIVMEDNGRGLPPEAERKGRGLRLLRSRVDYLQGCMVLEGGSAGGLLVAVELPRTSIVL